jgi:hypothetical protein
MNDIERYDFWHREQDVFMQKLKEEKALIEFAKQIAKLPTLDLDELFCNAIKRKGA